METYKITKTIRFKLEAEAIGENFKANIETFNGNSEFDLANFITKLKNFCDDMRKYLFLEKRNELEVDGKIIIKKEWLRTYAKQALADAIAKDKAHTSNRDSNKKPRREQSTIDKYKGLKPILKEIFDEVDKINSDLATDASKELNERARREHTGLLLKKLSTKRALPCLVSLVENTAKKNEADDLSLRLKYLGAKLLDQLTVGTSEYLPAQSNGIPVAKASFNYYTINKKPVDYQSIIKSIEEKLLVADLKTFITQKFNLSKEVKESITEDIKAKSKDKQLLLGDYPFADTNTASLRQILKNIKAEQKAKFQEFMNDNPSLESLKLKTDLYLFNNITQAEFDEYARLTEQIEAKATSINQCSDETKKKNLRSELQKIKKDRGALLKDKFKTYKAFANFYGDVAKKHGKLLAQLKGIEKERAESQTTNYWSLILEQDGFHKLVLVPKEEASEFRKQLKPSTENNSNNKIYWLDSLTFRSLQKLCFGNLENGTQSNTFHPAIKKEIPDAPNGEFCFKGDEQQKIEFYQKVLNTNYAKQVLDLPPEVDGQIVTKNFNSLDDIIIALEKICYRRFSTVDEHIIQELNRIDAQIFNITSLDLNNEKNSNSKNEKYAHTDKRHTQIWKNFWTADNEDNNFDIRLNPEVTITYRKPKESRINKYGKGTLLFDQNKKNRYLHEQFTLITTISEHSNSPAKDLAFVSDEDFKKSIDEFNKTLTKDKVEFAIGLDNGEVELSTLGVYLPQINKSTNEEKIAELKKTKDCGFQVFRIKDLSYAENDTNGKPRKIIQNPSYFVKEDVYCRTFGKTKEEYEKMFANVFEEKYLLTLDLTTAKVIDGKIIENGDVSSLFNLWMRHAQRNIYEMNDHAKKETAKRIILKKSDELNDEEKAKFIDYLNEGNKKYAALSDAEKATYVTWIYDVWNEKIKEEDNDKFKKVKNKCKRKGTFVPDDKIDIVFAVCKIGEDIESVKVVFDVRNVFKLRKGEFDTIKTEKEIFANLEKYNKRTISNEELGLQINMRIQSLVANVVGVVDFLYKQYQNRFGGEGIIVKEGFDHGKVEKDREKFSGNIYRILERKLYQKFQNYGLVPPIKNLMLLRSEGVKGETKIMRLGNICFVDEKDTSQMCPVCDGKLMTNHGAICSSNCGFEHEGIMHSNDGIAGFNIAKRGFNNFE